MLNLRRQHHDTDGRFWSVTCEGEKVGSIVRSLSDHPWEWSITVQYSAPLNKSGRADTRDEAMVAFRAAWERYRAHIGDEGWRRHLAHMAQLRARPWHIPMMERRAATEVKSGMGESHVDGQDSD